ncbi:SGNH/GDSL hydrolase family protein [Brevundimonas sp.]|uniref:SGNH/GDSL hydrolase family protein n=1 Tax=Brevundimonas sp. TaxID=1871086 RepID=UPI002D5C63D5|nr:SGNH/GDSL hydrolase family protein [Brevundimonas sp.]HYC96590.1 SGNH/GDSL hydrolase family protein [Brevundimonas sp.]
MTIHRTATFLLLACALALALPAGAGETPAEPLPVHVGGRAIVETDGSLSFGWPGVYFESRFRGPGVRIRLDAPAEHMRLLIDGEERLLFREAGLVDVTLQALPDADHVIRLEKLTESQTGGGRFIGFFPSTGSTPLPPPVRSRQIEFIGDSHSVGYGVASADRSCTADQVHDLTDTQQAFGPRLARRLDADYRVNAYSGFGVVRNYDGTSAGLSLPLIYDRLKPDSPDPIETTASGWRPAIIVINLGTNDFSTPLKAGEPWRDAAALRSAWRGAYVAFIGRLMRNNPDARFILMGSDAFVGEAERVAAAVNAGAPGRVTTLRFDGLDLGGCDWHPSAADQERLADLLEAVLRGMDDPWREAAR